MGGLAQLTPGDVMATLRAISIRFRRVGRVLMGPVDDASQQGGDVAAWAAATGWRVAGADRVRRDGPSVRPAGILLLRDQSPAVVGARLTRCGGQVLVSR